MFHRESETSRLICWNRRNRPCSLLPFGEINARIMLQHQNRPRQNRDHRDKKKAENEEATGESEKRKNIFGNSHVMGILARAEAP